MMNNPVLFSDEQFNPNNSGVCHLLIHLGTTSYSYAIVDKRQGRLNVVGKNYFPENTSEYSALNRLEILIAENEFVSYDFEKVKISLQTQAFTFIPRELYSHDDLPRYSKFLGAQPDSILIETDIRPFEIKNICAVDTKVETTLRKSFVDLLLVCQANPLIAGVHNQKKNRNAGELFLNFNRDSFEAVVVKSDMLEFYNIFEIENPDEFNYFLLGLVNEFNINADLPVTVSGEIDNHDEKYLRLQKYFEHIAFADSLTSNDQAFEGFNPHVFFSVLSLDLCE